MTHGTVVYDGDCGFCTRSAHLLERFGSCEIVPWQYLDLQATGLTEEQVTAEVQWLDSTGRPAASGAAAIAEALKTCGPPGRLAGSVVGARLVRPLSDRVYDWVAAHRYALPGGTPACRMEDRPS